MATVVNNAGKSDSAAGMGILIGLVVLLALGLLLWTVGLPAWRRAGQTNPTTIENQVELPVQDQSANPPLDTPNQGGTQGEGGPNIQVPEQINVDIQGLPNPN